MNKSFLIALLSISNFCHSQTPKIDITNSAIKDSLDFIKTKKKCHIKEYTGDSYRVIFKTDGELIKAYSMTSSDNMMTFSVALSTVDTVWSLELKAYGNIWVSNPTGLNAIGGIGEKSISMPEIPLSVEFDKQKQRYVYTANLVAKTPFKSIEDQTIGSNIYYIMSCSVYKLYIFDHIINNSELQRDCFTEITTQLLTQNDKEKLKAQKNEWDQEFGPLIKQAQEEYDRKNKKPPKKKKN